MNDQPYRWYYGLGTEPERYGNESFATREEATVAGLTEARGTHDKITLIEGRPGKINYDIFTADNVIEDLHEHNEEITDEDFELGVDPGREERADLERRLAATLREWTAAHGLGHVTVISDIRHELVLEVPA